MFDRIPLVRRSRSALALAVLVAMALAALVPGGPTRAEAAAPAAQR